MTTSSMPQPTSTAPRKSRLRWYLLCAALLFILVPFGGYFVAGMITEYRIAQIERQLDQEDPGWRLPDILAQREAPPDEQNSALQVQRIHALLAKKNPFGRGGKWENEAVWNRPNLRLPKESADALQAAFALLTPGTLDEARKLKDMPKGSFALPSGQNPFTVDLDLQRCRRITHLLQLDVSMRSQMGDHDGAAESCQALINLAAAMCDQPTLIGMRVRLVVLTIAVEESQRTLAQGPVLEANLATLQALFETAAGSDGLHNALRGERACAHQAYRDIRAGNAKASDFTSRSPGSPGGFNDRLADVFPSLVLGSHVAYLKLMNENVTASKLPFPERALALAEIEKNAGVRQASAMTKILMIAIAMTAESTQRTQVNLRCASVALAVERYRIQRGRWPTRLEEVVAAGLLKGFPKDPYDGKPLRFQRTETGVSIYSVGPDLIDNGGMLDRIRLLSPGSDLGFELWDPNRRGLPPPVELDPK